MLPSDSQGRVDFWPDLNTPPATATAVAATGVVPADNSTANVTPSPVVTGRDMATTSSISYNQNYGSVTCATINGINGSSSSRSKQNERREDLGRNPIQLLSDSISSFLRINLVGKDERDDHRAEPRPTQPIKSSSHLSSAEQSVHLDSNENEAIPTASSVITDSTPLLVTGLAPRTTSRSRPIKFSSPSTSPAADEDETLVYEHENRNRIRRSRVDSSPDYDNMTCDVDDSQPQRQQSDRDRQSFIEANHRRHSAPIDMMSNSTSTTSTPYRNYLSPLNGSPASPSLLAPDDFYDQRDGHLWRAKYCVLEDGCLYFYRNKNDGDSAEAAAERKRSHMISDNNDDDIVDPTGKVVPPVPQAQSLQHRISIESARRSSEASNLSGISSRRRTSAKDLSKSPMPVGRTVLHHFDSNHLIDHGLRMWEKRVFMDCVGGVRTAEQQYGQNSFELQALDDEQESHHVDTLVLQAPNHSEMKEWIFQFHRSLASVMMDIMHVFGSTPGTTLLNRTAYLDIHHPSMNMSSSHHGAYGGGISGIPHSPSEKQLHRLIAMSPRFSGNHLPIQQPLSHGHGRHSLRRRRSDIKKPGTPPPASDDYVVGTTSLSSTPETGDTVGSPRHQFPFREPSPSSGHAAEEMSPPSRVLIPPPIIQSNSLVGITTLDSGINNKIDTSQDESLAVDETFLVPKTPEFSALLSNGPQTERPQVATGKYIPPHMITRRHEQADQPASSATASVYVPPHLRRKQQETVRKKYVPPHLRGANAINPAFSLAQDAEATNNDEGELLSLAERAKLAPVTTPPRSDVSILSHEKTTKFETKQELLDFVGPDTIDFIRGGCADPDHVQGSILDPMFIPKKASRVGKVQADAYGSYGGGPLNDNEIAVGSSGKSSLRWEIGAVSECGIRDSNEDAFLIAGDLLSAFAKESLESALPVQQTWKTQDADHNLGLFAVFDGHCGNHAARFSVERLTDYIKNELHLQAQMMELNDRESHAALSPLNIESILRDAIMKMDDAFCHLCHLDGRQWESGATALVAMVANEHLVIGNLGDCRGVLCRVVSDAEPYRNDDAWSALDSDEHFSERITPSSSPSAQAKEVNIFWKEITNVHSPSAEHERVRIEKANGWITTETEIPIGQLRRIDFLDEDVIEILQRCFNFTGANQSDRLAPGSESEKSTKECKAAPQRILTISRICGELSVSRALGDRDFKAAFNGSSHGTADADASQVPNIGSGLLRWWDSPLFLPYPDDHSRRFQGDLVSNTPEFQRIRVGEKGVSDEFVVLACDGLWDVMDADDAVRISRNLLYKKKWTVKKTAARLAELAIHLGSSDNVTVVIIRLFSKDDKNEGNKQR